MPKVIGVTGGIATGKSTVVKILRSLGAKTLSADEIAREVLAIGTPGYYEVVSEFGKEILKVDGEIDRRKLAEIVFSDSERRKRLEEITHPQIIGAIRRQIDEFRNYYIDTDDVLVVEIPLLFEVGLTDIVDLIIVVAAEQETQVNRLTSMIGVSYDEARRRIDAQLPLDAKISGADVVIWNDDSPEKLEREVKRLVGELHLL